MSVDWSQPLRTRNGRRATVVGDFQEEGCAAGKLVAVDYVFAETAFAYNEDGTHRAGARFLDLLNP